MAVLVDTSVFVAVERERIGFDQLIQSEESYAVSVVSAGELLHGVHRATGRRAQARSVFVEGLLASFEPISIDMLVARAYARAAAELARKSTPVDANDLWIAATALAFGFDLLAFDGDFDRIPGVRRVPMRTQDPGP